MNPVAQKIDDLIRQRRLTQAEAVGRNHLAARPDDAPVWLQLGRVLQIRVDFDGMLACARRVIDLTPGLVAGRLQEIDALIHCGRASEAVARLRALEKRAGGDMALRLHLAEFYTHCGCHEAARRCYEAVRRLKGDDPAILYNCATAALTMGEIDKAEALLGQVIALNPHDYDAYYNRATLRRQTPERNHIDEMEALLAAGLRHPAGEVQLGYALAREYEDLGEHERAFACLKKGAGRRNSLLQYRVEDDVETAQAIKKVMAADFLAKVKQTPGPGPIFIIGLPRSGTTLVERILGSHSQVDSLGEINDFALSLMSLAGPTKGKQDLVAKSTGLDFEALGARYRASIASRQKARQGPERAGAPWLIDKTPANYLYIGLIARALPEAKIIHLRRNPMDVCYAMYKTLFRMGYPFSYDLDNLARYYLSYRDLMAHWRAHLPGRFLDLDYEALVGDQEAVSRRLVAHCGLAWEPACLDFHLNASPSATASAAQVRRPLYRDSLEKWRCYETQLAPLKERLVAAGVALDIRGAPDAA